MIVTAQQRLIATRESPAKIAVVGAGYFSQFHLRGWAQCENAEVVAVCDSDANRVVAMAAQYDVSGVFSSAETLLDNVKVDVLDIATPPPTHAALIRAAIARSVRVICQKPFAAHYQQALELTELAEEAGIDLIVHENFRFMPWYREAKRLLDQRTLGDPHGILFRLRPGDGQGADAYLGRQPYFQKMRRFLVVETAIHFVDTFRYLMGEVIAVSARLRKLNPHIVGEDAGVITFEFANGAVGILDANRSNDHVAVNPRCTMGEMWLEGSAGVLRLDGDARLWWKPHYEAEREHAYLLKATSEEFGGGACTNLQRHALSAFTSGNACENTARDYLTNLRIQEAIYASHQTGQRIVLTQFEPTDQPIVPSL
jgi:D-apiose dehydrogenase